MEEMARSALGDVLGMPTSETAKSAYEAYRTVGDLPSTAKALYSAAGKCISQSSFLVIVCILTLTKGMPRSSRSKPLLALCTCWNRPSELGKRTKDDTTGIMNKCKLHNDTQYYL